MHIQIILRLIYCLSKNNFFIGLSPILSSFLVFISGLSLIYFASPVILSGKSEDFQRNLNKIYSSHPIIPYPVWRILLYPVWKHCLENWHFRIMLVLLIWKKGKRLIKGKILVMLIKISFYFFDSSRLFKIWLKVKFDPLRTSGTIFLVRTLQLKS